MNAAALTTSFLSRNNIINITCKNSYKVSYRAHSSDSCVYGPLPVSCLCGLLSEEEIHFVIVSVIIIRDEVG